MWLADRHSDQELYTAAKHCAKIHLSQLHQTEEFLNLPLCLLLDIIKGITLYCAVTVYIQKKCLYLSYKPCIIFLNIAPKYHFLNHTPLLTFTLIYR